MAVPARKTSTTKRKQRRAHLKLKQPAIHLDPTTGDYQLSHHVTPSGFYKGRKVITEDK